MANTFLTNDVVASEALLLLRNNLVAAQIFDRDYEQEFTGTEKVGDTIRLRRRGSGTVREFGGSITKDDMTEVKIDLKLEKHFDVSIALGAKDLTLSIDDFSRRILAPNLLAMAEKIDAYALGKLKYIPNVARPSKSAPAALPDSVADLALVEQSLNEGKVPGLGRVHLMSAELKATLMGAAAFHEADKRGDGGAALRSAELGEVMTMRHFLAQNIDTATHTTGTQTSAVVNKSGGVAAGETSIPMDGGAVATGTLKVGDILTIGGYGNVVVAEDVTFASNAATVKIDEPLSKVVADDSAVTVYDGGGNDRSLHGAAMHPRCMALAAIPMVVPPDANGFTQTYEGLAVRVIRDYDNNAKESVLSIDALVGARVAHGELGYQVVKDG